MAINTKEFTETIEVGLKANKTFTRFYLRYKQEGKSNRKLFDYSNKHWDKRTRIAQAKADSIKAKTKMQEKGAFDENSNIDHIAKLYIDLKCEKSQWTDDKYRSYELHVQPIIGKKKIKDLRSFHLDQVKKSMEHKGFNKQSKDGSSPRTIKKVLIQILKPIIVYAYDNRAIERVPKFPNIKQTRKKKTVDNASDKLISLHSTIMDLYFDNPFYRALFLFALYGRRWGEIKTLEWSDIDMLQNTYTIRAERNKIKSEQCYDLPQKILIAIQGIQDDRVGLVFKSPKTKGMLSTPKKQLERIRKNSGIENLTMHYFRHILVSAMGEMGVANTILSASLGHTNLDTVNQFYLSANHLKSSGIANQAIGEIINI
jgi:integrase